MEKNSVKISEKLVKLAAKTSMDYHMIREGDNIAVGFSGGKDSHTLLHVLKEIQKKVPFSFQFTAVTVTYGMGENFSAQKKHCEENGIAFHLHETETFDLAKEKIRENSSFCSFFSRMRRGALSAAAEKLGCNVLALGHHLDDAAESFFMGAAFNGTLRTLAPCYVSESGLRIIRPLIFAREKDLRAEAEKNFFHTVGDEMCPGMRFNAKMPHARAEMKMMLKEWEEKNPHLFDSLRKALGNIQSETFF